MRAKFGCSQTVVSKGGVQAGREAGRQTDRDRHARTHARAGTLQLYNNYYSRCSALNIFVGK